MIQKRRRDTPGDYIPASNPFEYDPDDLASQTTTRSVF